MPTKTKMLDHGGFVHSPEVPMSSEFVEYLKRIDPLLGAWHEATDRWNDSPMSPELVERKRNAQRAFDEFAAAYQDKFTIRHVERDPTFLPVARFFARYRPIRRPFSILNCSLDLPLHTVFPFEHTYDLPILNAALDSVTPMRWWQVGPSNHPCYLFGELIWELKQTEVEASSEGLILLFEKAMEKDQLQRDRLGHGLAGSKGPPVDTQYIPELVRVVVWRRDGGKCACCGSRDDVDFVVQGTVPRGSVVTAQQVKSLCARCRAK